MKTLLFSLITSLALFTGLSNAGESCVCFPGKCVAEECDLLQERGQCPCSVCSEECTKVHILSTIDESMFKE